MTRGRWFLALGLAASVIAGALWALRPQQRSVILITIDTMRPDRISAYGYTTHQTPHLDRLAREGALFENAFCDVTWTTPSMASVMTGTYATRHGLRSSFQSLKPEALTLAEVLKSHEIQTAAIIASYPLHSIFGLNQGFDLYDEHFSNPLSLDENVEFGPVPPVAAMDTPPSDDTKAMRWFLIGKAQGEAYRPDDQVSDRAITWLRQERHAPFFLWIHYFGPHEKPTGLVGLTNDAASRTLQLAAYDPDVVTVDAEIGRVLRSLDELGIANRTAVILHADHGQSLMEHDYFGHGRNVYDPTARIPLIIRAPGRIPPGRRDPGIARNVDIFPTVLDLLGLPKSTTGDGASLLGQREGGDAAAYLETYLSGTWLFADVIDRATNSRLGFRRLAMRTSRWKLVVNDPIPFLDREPEPLPEETSRRHYTAELYDLVADPGETLNLIFQQPAVAEELRLALWRTQGTGPTTSQPMPMDDTTRERLKALGYLAE